MLGTPAGARRDGLHGSPPRPAGSRWSRRPATRSTRRAGTRGRHRRTSRPPYAGSLQRTGCLPTGCCSAADHLGPNPWKHLPAEEALSRAARMVADYVAAGFTKIHGHLRAVRRRPARRPAGGGRRPEQAAGLGRVAESSPDPGRLRYVIGTEVPVPGGESAGTHGIHVSTAADVSHTIAATRAAFEAARAGAAWDRVRALVAQPGVEFSRMPSCSSTRPVRPPTWPAAWTPGPRGAWCSRHTAPTTRPEPRWRPWWPTGSRSSRSDRG
ncbi:MAG: class II D-tagatose-bisphosphate aldolase, non-catalytic subunit [Nocardioides sp.]